MKTGILITARLGSTRLKSKHLLPVSGQPVVAYLIRRIAKEFQKEIHKGLVTIVIATSDEAENRAFEQFSQNAVTVSYGSKDNIPLRHVQTANDLSLDAIVSVDGDDILCSVSGMRKVYEALLDGKPYVKITGLPFGMNSWGYSTEFLLSSFETHHGDVLETGWGRIFDDAMLSEIRITFPIEDNTLRFTLDYEQDYRFFSEVIQAVGQAIDTISDEEIVRLVRDNGLYQLNESISKEYWNNFYRVQEEEMQQSLLRDPDAKRQ